MKTVRGGGGESGERQETPILVEGQQVTQGSPGGVELGSCDAHTVLPCAVWSDGEQNHGVVQIWG